MSHKADWDSFVRNKEYFKFSEYFSSNKLEIFTFRVDSGRSWEETKMFAQRIHEEQNSSGRGWDSMRGKDVKAKYGDVKGQKLMETRRTQGWFYEDPDFPGDPDDACPILSTLFPFYAGLISFGCVWGGVRSKEAWYYVRASQKFRNKEKFTDRFTLESTSRVDDKLRNALIDKENGIMRPGAMPKLQCASSADCKNLLGTMAQAIRDAPK